jgi:hypothetical protein
MELCGYRLVDTQNSVIAEWGGTLGQCPGIPNPLFLPNGDHVHAPSLDTDYGGYRLLPIMLGRSLDDEKTIAIAKIDADAETARLKYITAGAGQALEYQEAAEEAARYIATGGAGAYPMLQASVDAGEAPDLATAAALIGARENAWATIGANIRRLRLTAKRAVDAATTVEQVQAAAQVTWP